MSKLRSFIIKHKNNIFFKPIFSLKNLLFNLKNDIGDWKAKKRLRKIGNRHKNKEIINILFLVIDPNTWNKLKPLYEEMQTNKYIKLFMICVPSMPFGNPAATYEYFKGRGYDCIDARLDKGKWFDIKSLEPDYIFYSEPYNGYLPKPYRTNITSTFAKLCIATYGMTISEEFLKIRPRDFYRDIYLCYTNNYDEQKYNIAQFKKTHKKGYQKTKYLGFVAFSDFINNKNNISLSWEFSKNDFRAIWTPRWTIDEQIGGSNFFRYKDLLIRFAEMNSNIDLLIRPHPMALNNFIQTGQMTQEEVDQFKEKCKNLNNLNLDVQKTYTSTFWQSSVLISDVSSIIVEYFITGKPIIFCQTKNFQTHFLPFFKRILDGCYIVKDWEELVNVLQKIISGNDELISLRNEIKNELFGEDFSLVPKSIVNDILCDFGIK